jgi:hypothetical protein
MTDRLYKLTASELELLLTLRLKKRAFFKAGAR